jgi:hypothetical protein
MLKVFLFIHLRGALLTSAVRNSRPDPGVYAKEVIRVVGPWAWHRLSDATLLVRV